MSVDGVGASCKQQPAESARDGYVTDRTRPLADLDGIEAHRTTSQ
jgi:hypothetical protein